MGHARLLDDCVVAASILAASQASAPTTGSGKWFDTTDVEGDILVVVNVGSVTGSFGSLAVQVQCADDVNGTGAANVVDPTSGSSGTGYTVAANGLLTITATGTYAIAITGAQAKRYLGVACTFTGITAAVMGVDIVTRTLQSGKGAP